MLNVFLLEDDAVQRELYTAAIQKHICINDYDMKFALSTSNADDIVQYIKYDENVGLYFLDVQIGNDETCGFELGKIVKKYDPRGYIVILSSYPQNNLMAILNYKLEPLDYIIKRMDTETTVQKIRSNIDVAHTRHMTKARGRHKVYPVNSGDMIIVIDYADIYYFEVTGNRRITLHAKNKSLEFSGQLKHLEQHFYSETNFVKCDRGILVNCDHIVEYHKKRRLMKMRNGDSITASIRGVKHVDAFYLSRREQN